MKPATAIILLIALVFGGYTLFAVDESLAIQDYIKSALINGCRPVIDICTSNCSKAITEEDQLKAGVSQSCVQVVPLRVTAEKAQNNYISLAKKLGVEKIDLQTISVDIRERLKEKGEVLEAPKEKI